MAAAAAVDGNGNDAADEKARDVTDQSKTLGRNSCADGVPPSAVPVGGDPGETFGFLGNLADDDLQFDEDDHGDSTECSSSFGPSCPASDDDMDGIEVDSPFLGPIHANAGRANSAPSMVRHKEVTAQWKKMAAPIMWRCQWLELRMKNLLSQVAKYDKELAVINHEKDLQLEMVKADGPESETVNLDSQSNVRIIMKRRKRRRDEAVDDSLYMMNHPALSYYYGLASCPCFAGLEKIAYLINKSNGVQTDGRSVNGGFDSSVPEDIGSSHDDALLENDRIIEQYSLREILRTVDNIQSRILGLQGYLSNARSKYESQVKLSQKNQKVKNHITSCKKDGRRSLQKTKALHSLLQKDDLDRPLPEVTALLDRPADCMMGYMKRHDAQEDAIQSHADITTFDMLFGADNVLTNAHVGEFCKESADDVLIDNTAVKKEGYQHFERVEHAAEKHSELIMHPSEIEKAHIVGCEQVLQTAPVVKQMISGDKRGQKPDTKHGGSLLANKIKTEQDPSNMKIERPALMAVDPRRSKRVRKPKIY
uniref:Uncharacterized protein n=1 Tax=Leersia perrieri TaxID=77586 RepID=A0A0D9WFP0_9ORYZ